MHFIDNKYKSWYDRIVSAATKQNRVRRIKTDPEYVYYEKHHIIPRALGGSNDDQNLVLLTAREHFVCHLLLCKFVERSYVKRMIQAYVRFFGDKSSHHYEIRKFHKTFLSNNSKGSYNPMYGKRRPQWLHDKLRETNRKNRGTKVCISNPITKQMRYVKFEEVDGFYADGWVKGNKFFDWSGRNNKVDYAKSHKKRTETLKKKGINFKGENNPMYGKPCSEERKKRISAGIKRFYANGGTIVRRKFTDEEKKRMSVIQRKRVENMRNQGIALGGNQIGKIHIKHEFLQKGTMILREDLETYLSEGWTLGMHRKKSTTNK